MAGGREAEQRHGSAAPHGCHCSHDRVSRARCLDHVLQANEGCDFDFLRALPGEPAETEPLGLLSGWVGGW